MSDNPGDRPFVDLSFPSINSAIATIVSLSGALQVAVEMAVFPERIEVNDKPARLDVLTNKLLDEVKNKPTISITEADEAAGMTAALTLVDQIARSIKRKI